MKRAELAGDVATAGAAKPAFKPVCERALLSKSVAMPPHAEGRCISRVICLCTALKSRFHKFKRTLFLFVNNVTQAIDNLKTFFTYAEMHHKYQYQRLFAKLFQNKITTYINCLHILQ